MYLYQFIYMVWKYNNLPKFLAAQVSNSIYAFFVFIKLFNRRKVSIKKIDKEFLFKDWFLFNWAENIFVIDLIIDDNFSNSHIRYLPCFFVVDKWDFLISCKYLPAIFFQTSPKIGFSSSHCIFPLLSLNLSYILSPLSLSTSKLFLLAIWSLKLNILNLNFVS